MCFRGTEAEGQAQEKFSLCLPFLFSDNCAGSYNLKLQWELVFNFFLFIFNVYIYSALPDLFFISRPGKKASSGISQGEMGCVLHFSARSPGD